MHDVRNAMKRHGHVHAFAKGAQAANIRQSSAVNVEIDVMSERQEREQRWKE